MKRQMEDYGSMEVFEKALHQFCLNGLFKSRVLFCMYYLVGKVLRIRDAPVLSDQKLK